MSVVWFEKSTNVRTKYDPVKAGGMLGQLLDAVRPWSAAEAAARAFLVPDRVVRPPMMPEPAGGVVLAVPGFAPHLNARAWGPADRPAVLLAHGWDSHLYAMLPLVEPLLDAGFRVVAYDAPGHGRSSGDMAALTDMARAAAAVARAAGGVVGAVGHSMGAAALGLALEEGAHLGRVALVAAPSEPLPYALDCARAHRLDADQTRAMLDIVDRRMGRPLAGLSVPAAAQRFTAPALLVHSLDDRIAPVADALRIAAAWPGARTHLVEGLGHRRILADGEVVRTVVGFLAKARA